MYRFHILFMIIYSMPCFAVSADSPLSDSKSGHPLSPPVANGEHRQRLPNSEKSKENQQMNRKSTDDPDGKAMEIG